jgi:subtilisin family serine protease
LATLGSYFSSCKEVERMQRERGLPGFGVVLAAVLFVPALAAADAPDAVGKVDQLVVTELAIHGRTNVFAKMAGDASLAGAKDIADRVTRLNYVHDTLTAHAASSQKALTAFLDRRGVRYTSFWINNSVYVYGADGALVDTLAARGDVAYVRADHEIPLHRPVSMKEADAPQAIEWGVAMINADDVWATGNRGGAAVVASIDTGVRWTHNALDDQYRGAPGAHDYNWWDPDHVFAAPTDNNGHGTHTMGTMVGDDGGANQIGVAPEARWIAAQGCDGITCSDFDLTSSAQFLTCPTRVDGSDPDCSKAPHVINNSWGGGGGDAWYKPHTDAWAAAGIMPIFSNGNSGPFCNSAGSPGDYRFVIGVGAVNINSVLASFSSKGPGFFRPVKPDFVAPGDGVRSSYNTSDTAYSVLSGTSMAAPHVSGAIALMVTDSPTSPLMDYYLAFRATAVQGLPNPPNPDTCAGKPYTVYPNFHYGHGRIDALAAVNALP